MSNSDKKRKIKLMEYVSTLPRYFQRLPKSINRFPRYLLISVLIHFAFTLVLGFVVGVPSYRPIPISVSIIEDTVKPNDALPTGKIIDISTDTEEELSDDATLLAAIDSRAKMEGSGKLKTGKEEQVSIEQVRLSGRDAEKGIVVQKAKTKQLAKSESPEVEEIEKKVSDNFQDVFGTSRFTVEKRESKADTKGAEELKKRVPNPVVDLEQGSENPLIEDEQEGEPLLKGADIDLMVKETPYAFYETGNEAVVSLNTKRFKYAAYFLEIRKAIEAVWFYPDMAIMHSLAGDTFIRFTVLQNGELESVAIIKSSGEKILDDASVKALERAMPFHRFPETIKKKKIHITANFNHTQTFIPTKNRR